MVRHRCHHALIALLALGLWETRGRAAEVPPSRSFDVRDHGAVANGTTLDTAAIQKAIDTCRAAGGGTVCFTAGVYLSGTLFLKDNVHLVLEAGAILRGSRNPTDYPHIPRKNLAGRPAFSSPTCGGGFLLYADTVHNVSIEGPGAIDGQGPEFWFKEMLSPAVRKPKPERPRAMICIVKGDALLFRDISLVNSPCYTLWLLGCNNVHVDGIAIRNPHDGPNTDGIDVDCSSSVRITNCSITGGDDAIAIKSDSGTLAEEKPCENVVVTNCTLCSPPACGVRIGYEGDAVIRDCTLNNLTISNSSIGIDILSILPHHPTILKGTRCESIVLSNIAMRNVGQAIYFWMGNETGGRSQVSLKNILVSNVVAQSRLGSYIGGCPQQRAENVTLSNVRLILTGHMPDGAALTGSGVWGGLNPYALYCSQVDGLRLGDVDIDLREARGHWRYGVFCEELRHAALRGIHTQGCGAVAQCAVIGCKKTTATVRNCDAERQVPVFLHAEDGSKVVLSNCDLSRAKTVVTKDVGSDVTQSANRHPPGP